MQNSRFRFVAPIIITAVCVSIGYWMFLWSTDVFLYWGLNRAVSRWFAALITCAAVGTVLIRPIPVKVTMIATINLVLFSLLYTVLFLLVQTIWPTAASLNWLWQGGVAAVLSSAAVLLYGFFHGKRMVLTRYMVNTGLPVEGGSLLIALISDVHMGLTIDEPRLRRQIDRLRAEQPDLFLIAGDLVDDKTTPAQMRAACAAVGSLKTTYGTYFVYGNHDLANHGPKPPYTKEELDRALTEQGVHILDDQSFAVAGLTLIGRHDAGFAHSANRASLETLLKGVDRSKPIVLIDHQPRERKNAAASGITLQLSGHTHAGQVWPMSWIARLFSFAYGHRCTGGMHAIVSSGMGNRGSVMRSGCTAEMVLIRLQSTVS